MTLPRGYRLGDYEIESLIGDGGMGEVYRARDVHLNRYAALKVLPALLCDDARVARFRREAQILALLRHRNIAAIYGFVEVGEVKAFALEFIEGPTLAERISRGSLTVSECLKIAQQMCDAIAAADDRGIVHRDLKPSNIKIEPDTTVKVLDFGLSVLSDERQPEGLASEVPTVTDARITAAGTILGTPAYMSPEQAAGRRVDHPADIWAFGAILFEMLSGTRAFPGERAVDVLASVSRDDPDWRSLPRDLPVSVPRLLRRCLARELTGRYVDIRDVRLDVIDALADLLESNRILDVDIETVQRVFAYAPANSDCFCRLLTSLVIASTFSEALAVLDELDRELERRDSLQADSVASIDNALTSFIDAGLARLRAPGDRNEVQGKAVACYTGLLKSCTQVAQFNKLWTTHDKWVRPQKGREALRNETIRWFLPRLINSLPPEPLRGQAVARLEATIQSGTLATSEHDRNVVRSALFALVVISVLNAKDVARLLTAGFHVVTGGWGAFHEPWSAAIRVNLESGRLGADRHTLHHRISHHVLSIKWDIQRRSEYIHLTKIMAELRDQKWRPLNCFDLIPPIDALLNLWGEPTPCKITNVRRPADQSRPGAWLTSEHGPPRTPSHGTPARLELKVSESSGVVIHGRVYGVSTNEDPYSNEFRHPCGYRFSFDEGHEELLRLLPEPEILM
jgi:serine/threonine protein kinase